MARPRLPRPCGRSHPDRGDSPLSEPGPVDPGPATPDAGFRQLVACPDCRALVSDFDGPTHAYLGGNPGCWAAWGELQARAYADPAVARVMPLAVDAYAAQHHGVEGRRQGQSVWAHLVSLCSILERGRTPFDGIRIKQNLLRDHPVFAWLDPPADPGTVTVLDMAEASGPDAVVVVRRWAQSVWDAWSAHRDAIRARTDEVAPRR